VRTDGSVPSTASTIARRNAPPPKRIGPPARTAISPVVGASTSRTVRKEPSDEETGLPPRAAITLVAQSSTGPSATVPTAATPNSAS
jgi:hypothetical protein